MTLSRGFTAQDTFVAKIVDLNEKIPPDPLATDVNPGYSVPSLPVNPQKLSASWGVWSCYWVPDWQWCSHGEDDGHWVDRGDWEYDYLRWLPIHSSADPCFGSYGMEGYMNNLLSWP